MIRQEVETEHGPGDIRTYTYNDKDQVIQMHHSFGYLYEYTYDENGNLSNEKRYNDYDNSLHSETAYTYDDAGRCLTKEYHRSYDNYWEKEATSYDSEGRELSYEKSDSSGTWEKRATTYIEDGRELTYDESASDGTWKKRASVYTENGKLKSYEASASDGTWSKRVATEDGNGYIETDSTGKWEKSEHSATDVVSTKTIRYKDQNDNLIREETTTYDEYGNRIKVETFNAAHEVIKTYSCAFKPVYVDETVRYGMGSMLPSDWSPSGIITPIESI